MLANGQLTGRAAAFVVERVDGLAGAAVLTRRRAAGNVFVLAVRARVARVAQAPK